MKCNHFRIIHIKTDLTPKTNTLDLTTPRTTSALNYAVEAFVEALAAYIYAYVYGQSVNFGPDPRGFGSDGLGDPSYNCRCN